jgi:hypothetical protein
MQASPLNQGFGIWESKRQLNTARRSTKAIEKNQMIYVPCSPIAVIGLFRETREQWKNITLVTERLRVFHSFVPKGP